MYDLYLVARRREPADAPRPAAEITLRARAAARAQERANLYAEAEHPDERGEPRRLLRVLARARARIPHARLLRI